MRAVSEKVCCGSVWQSSPSEVAAWAPVVEPMATAASRAPTAARMPVRRRVRAVQAARVAPVTS